MKKICLALALLTGTVAQSNPSSPLLPASSLNPTPSSFKLPPSSLNPTPSTANPICAKLAYNVIGDDYKVLLNYNPLNQTIAQRTLPGMQKPLLFTDSVIVNGNQITGKLNLLGWVFNIKGYQSPDSVNIVLVSPKTGDVQGSLVGGTSQQITTNYGAIAKEMVQTTRTYIYDTLLVHTPEWIAYEKEIIQLSPFAKDDLEFFAFANRNISKLSFTHFGMSKMSSTAWNSYFKNTYESETPATLKELNPSTALLTINSFGGNGQSLERFMQAVIAKNYKNLIIDLRTNLGGGAGAVLALTKYLGENPKPAGALLTNKWFLKNNRIPTAKDYKKFAVFSGGSTNDLIKLFATQEGIILKTKAAPTTFNGTVHILTSGRTASACEPFVYGLQYFKRATIVGEKTAGAMLSKIPFEMTDGFKVFLPVTDYYTIDGVRLDKNGVVPSVTSTAAEALNTSLALLEKNK